MATADFKINTSVQADRGYDATNSEAITLTLENAPAIDVYKVVYSVVTASDGAPAITFSPGSGQPTTPTGNVTFTTTGSGFHSYLIQCQVNDGKRQTDRGLVVDAGYTKQRMIVIRGALTNLRKTVPAETTQYGSDGWSVALNELAEAIENGSVGGISTTEPIVTYGAAPTIPNAVDLTAITTTVAASSTTVQPIAVRLNPSTNDTVLDVFSLRRSTTHASNGATGIGARMFVELEDSAGNVDSAAQHIWDYLDATSTSEDARYTIRLQVAGSLTDVLSLRGTTIRVPVLAGGGSRVVTVDNNGDFGATAASGLAAVSGTTNTIAKFTNTNVVGDGSITDASGTVNTTSVVTVTKAGIGTTKTAGLYSINTTASGSQVSAQIGGSAKHSGGTQHNFGWQCEPQSAGRAIWRLCYGTGDPVSSPPASTGSYVDTSEPSYGLSMWCNAFVSTGGTGFRCSAGGGGVKENGGTGQINFYGASTSIGTLLESALAVGDSDPCWDFYASAGTRTAGNFAQIRDGGGTVFAVSSATATRGRVSINGIPIGWNIVTTNVNATVAIGDRVHVQGGGITITLPAVPSVVSTRDHDIIIMEVNGAALGSPITINAAAGDLINGAASATINVPNGAMTLCHDGDGTNWRIVSSHLL